MNMAILNIANGTLSAVKFCASNLVVLIMKKLLIATSLIMASATASADVLVHKDAFGEEITHIATIVSHERNMLIFVCYPEGHYQANMYGNRAYHEPRIELITKVKLAGGKALEGIGSAIRNNQGVALDVPSSDKLLQSGNATLFAQGMIHDVEFAIDIPQSQVEEFKATCSRKFGTEFS